MQVTQWLAPLAPPLSPQLPAQVQGFLVTRVYSNWDWTALARENCDTKQAISCDQHLQESKQALKLEKISVQLSVTEELTDKPIPVKEDAVQGQGKTTVSASQARVKVS